MSGHDDALDAVVAVLPVVDQASARAACEVVADLLKSLGWPVAGWRSQARRHLRLMCFDDLPKQHRALDNRDVRTTAFERLHRRPKISKRGRGRKGLRVAGPNERPLTPRWRPSAEAEHVRHQLGEGYADADLALGELVAALRSGGVASTARAKTFAREALEALNATTSILRGSGEALLAEMRNRLDGGSC
jgi:hypothetical protein